MADLALPSYKSLMKILVFGGTGFIGKPLVAKLQALGHEVKVSDVRKDFNFANEIKQSDAVYNLGGHPIFKDRWDDRIKALIYDSRIEGTQKIVDAIGKARKAGGGPKTFISASAIGYYGLGADEEFSETSPSGSDFLAFVCRDWEERAMEAERHYDVRTVVLRTGVVLGDKGGALEKLLLPFKLMGGTLIGSGEQYFSWIHVDDMVGLYVHALQNAELHGPMNAVAPYPVRNSDFSHALGEALGRPQLGLMLPGFLQKAIGVGTKLGLYVGVGEAAEVIANGQKVLPTVAIHSGYKFQFPKVGEALAHVLKRGK
jgi:uncharacterized protein (TIGR01777 family)